MNRTPILTLFLLLHLASLFAIFPERMIAATSKGHWLPIAVVFLAELLILWLYLKGMSLFPGRTVVEICSDALGKWGTWLVVLPLMFFLLCQLALLLYYQTIEIKAVLLQRTPAAATSAIFVVICFYGAWKGLAAIIRASAALFFLLMPFLIFSMLISLQNFRVNYIFPVWDSHFSFISHSDFYVSLSILSGFLFLGMIPSKKTIRFGKMATLVAILFVFAMASVYIPLLVFGRETAVNFQYPMLMASDTIDLEWVVFDWLPSFYVVSSSVLGIVQFSVLLWMLVSLLHQLFLPNINRMWILPSLCAILYLSSLRIPDMDAMNFYLYLNSYFCLYSIIGFPVVVFLAALWQRKKVIT
ncbi:GerAB/ArcD/ProY family transporter [Paenibacillus algorifonticola]|uniref:GerAB/ArcD/ProY family transporter n=1 Tax=Paenibacillus algorifonticola TaxID=684063 RepID=UPI003D2DEC28